MLKQLHIENYALIKESEIEFDNGFVVITGETGAGKSILLGALSLLLGQRADMQVLKDREKKCVVEGQWDVKGLDLEEWFEEEALDYDDLMIVRREILPSGKSRAFVNDTPVQLAQLKVLGGRLIDIHSQHETLTLGNSRFQIGLLDTLSGNPEILAKYKKTYNEYVKLKRELERLTGEEMAFKKEQDYAQFQWNELNEAKLVEGEQEELEAEGDLLNHTETIKEALAMVHDLCENEVTGALSQLRNGENQLAKVVEYHKDLEQLHDRMDSALIELDDILSEVDRIDGDLQFSPERQQMVQERLDLIYRLEQKHGVESVAELIQIRDELGKKLERIVDMEDEIRTAMEQVDKSFGKLQQVGDELTKLRRKSANYIEKAILIPLSSLGMKEARLKVEMTELADYGTMGHDAVEFLFNANRGGELRELSKVASGGEMSRLMLAIKSLITEKSLLPTIVFDEIDTGVSGDISVAVGDIMKAMAERMQVIAITHMPQIAAKAVQHLKVYKQIEGNATMSRIKTLSTEERVNEIAVMLSSDPPSDSALQTAKELMEVK